MPTWYGSFVSVVEAVSKMKYCRSFATRQERMCGIIEVGSKRLLNLLGARVCNVSLACDNL